MSRLEARGGAALAKPAPRAPRTPPVALDADPYARSVPLGFTIGGYLQAQFEAHQLSEDQLQQGGSPLNQDRFLLRRGRLRVDHGWQYVSAALELDANTARGVSFGVRRAEASLLYRGANPDSLTPLVMLTLGVTDLPFGYELAESTRARFFMERSQASLALFPTEADVGVKLSGALSVFRYALALTNGEPLDTLNGRWPRDPNAAKDLSGRFGVEASPLPTLSLGGGLSFARGKGFHAGTGATKAGVAWRDDNEDGRVQPAEIVPVPASAASPSRNFSRWAYGVDLELSLVTPLGLSKLYGEAYIASNHDRAVYVADPVLTGVDVREAGAYVALLQNVTRYGVVGLRYSVYDPNSDLFDLRQGTLLPTSARISALSPLLGLILPGRARLLFQYDFIDDKLARDAVGVPTNARNDVATVRFQVEL